MSSHDEKDLLTRELRERSSDVGGHPIGFDAVRKSARRIQRRRQVLAGAVAAVVRRSPCPPRSPSPASTTPLPDRSLRAAVRRGRVEPTTEAQAVAGR